MKRPLRIAFRLLAAVSGVTLALLLGAWLTMRASLPALDGELKLAGLSAAATIGRDERGTAILRAANAIDGARVLGFLHGQERFFEMDLARRAAAGELSELFGKATLEMDKDKRRHRMRARLAAHYAAAPAADQAALTAYAEGVNAGLQALGSRPWQYWALRSTPRAWQPVDSMLVTAEMTFMLQARSIDERLAEIGLRNMVGDALFEWLKPSGGAWDAALDGSTLPLAPLPSPSQVNTRESADRQVARLPTAELGSDPMPPGSNNWAVGGTAAAEGGAILADDMHLGIGVPAIWYRAQFEIGTGDDLRRVAGVTLPGVPGMVVGSNGDLAWGFTNSQGQWFEIVAHPKAAPETLKTVDELILVKGGEPVTLKVREAPWGPLVAHDHAHDYSLWWAMYAAGGINLESLRLAGARNVDEALAIAQVAGIPHQNFLVADKAGNIAWTIMGRIPAKDGEARAVARGRALPVAQAARLPDGWLAPHKYPLIKNPPSARLWTANSRQTGGALAALIGDGGFDLGARARQIRERLHEKARLNEADLYAIQLDSESRFMQRWHALALSNARAGSGTKAAALAAELAKWNGRADADQTAYRIARQFRLATMGVLWETWLKAARRGAATQATEVKSAERPLPLASDGRFEYAVWQALEAKPDHLLPTPFKTWDEFLAAQLDAVYDTLIAQAGAIEKATWGQHNTARFKHPFSRALPLLSRVLDMPALPQSGDNHLPRVASPTFGASQRMVVAPGNEARGILTVAGGQSGHPLSPFYGAGHLEWHEGKAVPLLAGAQRHSLRLSP
jgi:penicillin amidase